MNYRLEEAHVADTSVDETERHQNRKRLRGHENRRVCDSKLGALSIPPSRRAGHYSRGGWGFSLKGANVLSEREWERR